MTMKNIKKKIISFLVIMVTLTILYNIIILRKKKTFARKPEEGKTTSQSHLRKKAAIYNIFDVDIVGTWNDSTLAGVVKKYELKFKDNPFHSRVQHFLTTLVHLTKARGNKTLWTHLNLMNLPPFPFDPTFHNPCWWSSSLASLPCDSHKKMSSSRSAKSLLTKYYNLKTHKETRLRCLPHFYVIGQGKSGTTDLFGKIRQHPDVVTTRKETQWICRKRLRYDVCPSIDSYIDLFQRGADHILRNHERGSTKVYIAGEGTPGYFSYNDFWDLLPGNEECKEPCITNADIIHHITPRAKLIVLLRNPTDRLYSHYFHKQGLFHKPTSREGFHHLVLKEIAKFQHCLESQTLRGCCYNYTVTDSLTEEIDLRRGIYHVFLSDWLKVFPREHLYIIKFEDYIVDGRTHLKNVFKFLNLRDIAEKDLVLMFQGPPANRRRADVKTRVGEMWNSTRSILDQFYKPFSKRLSALLKDDNFFW